MNDQSSENSSKLNNQLIELLEGLNDRKSRIDDQVKFLTNLPKILPFEPAPPNPSLVSRKTWETWWIEHDQIEKEAGIFREDEFALMKQVAMSKTTNMSREDTDLVGLTLCTLEAFSKLEHLLRSRRKQIQILDLRIKWDHQTKKVWQDLQELESQLPKILSKIRWNPASHDMDHQIHSAIYSPHFNSSSFPRPDSILSSSYPSPSSSKLSPLGSLSRSLPSRRVDFDPFASSDHSSLKSRPLDRNGFDTSPSRYLTLSPQLQLTHRTPTSREPTRFSRVNSVPGSNTPSVSPTTISSSSSSPQSRAMRIQSLTLQLSSITTKFHTLNRSVALTSTTIDQLIDSSLHVPVVFLDLQDELEAAVRSFQPTEAAKFYNSLMEQYREADDVWFQLFNLGLEVESHKREISNLLAATQIDAHHLANFEQQFDHLMIAYNTQALRTQLQTVPAHSNYPEQSNLNKLIIEKLLNGSERIKRGLDELHASVKIYRFAIETLQTSKTLRISMEECKQKLAASIQVISNLNKDHPQRPWLMNDPGCLVPHEKEKEYEKEWSKIMAQLKNDLLTGLNLLETTKVALKTLNAPGIDPNIKSEFQQVRGGLDQLINRAQQISIDKNESVGKLNQIRATWDHLLGAQTEIRKLHDRLLLDAHREKWRVKKVSSSIDALPAEELDSIPPPPPGRLRSYLEVEKHISESVQPLFKTSLAELDKDEQYRAVHQHFVKTFVEILNVQAPQLSRIEQTIKQICLQTSQVRKVESDYDTQVIEGGRWMKKVHDLIGLELEQAYDEFNSSDDLTEPRARQVGKSRSAEAIAQLTNYLGGIDLFCDSLSNRISFISTNDKDRLVMHDGRLALDCQAHNQSVRTHLNVLSMNLMSLKDQIFNESVLLQWINSPHVEEFDKAVNNVGNELKMVDVELDKLEANISRVQNLIESDIDEPFLTDDQLEMIIDQPLRDLEASLEQTEMHLSKTASVQLEAFIAASPTTSSSEAFKLDQFILPKQMSHHQLQSLYNQTCRRLKDIHTLSQKFKNEANSRRKNELAWRQTWARDIDEMTEDCDKLKVEISTIKSTITELEDTLVDWEKNRFRTVERIELEELNDRAPILLDELTSYQSRLSQSQANLDAFQNKIDLVHKRAVAVQEDIDKKLPVFINLVTDLNALVDQLRCQCDTSREAGLQVSISINRLKENVENFTKEREKRFSWKARCQDITNVELGTVGESFVQFDEKLAQISKLWRSIDEGESLEETQKNFFTLLSCLRSLHENNVAGFAMTKLNIEAAQTNLHDIGKQITSLSTKDVPHKYLTEAQAELHQQVQGFRERLKSLQRTEKELLDLICRVNSKHESWLTAELENEVLSKHCEGESARLAAWGQNTFTRFVDSVRIESEKIEKFRGSDEPSQPQTPIARRLQKSTSLAAAMEVLTRTDSDVKDQVLRSEAWIKSISEVAQRLEILHLSQTELARQIDTFRRTLPKKCSNKLEAILHGPDSEANVKGPDRFEVASSQLNKSESKLPNLIRFWEGRLAGAEENSRLIQNNITHVKRWSRLSDRLNEVDIDKLIDGQVNSQHSPLPNQAQLQNFLEILEETSNEIDELSNAGLMTDQSYSKEITDLLADRKQKAETLRHLVDFQSATQECDKSFSTLLDVLDVRRTDAVEIKIRDLGRSAFAAVNNLVTVSKKMGIDPRVEYHTNRSKQTWQELESLIKDKGGVQKDDSKPRSFDSKRQSTSTLPLPVRATHHLGGVTNTPPPLNASQTPSILPRLKHSSDRAMERVESPGVATRFMDSPSYMASCRYGKRTPDPFTARRNTRTPTYNSRATRIPRQSLSKESNPFPSRTLNSESSSTSISKECVPKEEFNSLGSASYKAGKERPRLHSVQGTTPLRFSASKYSATAPNSNSTPTLYKPQLNRNIDKLVGNVVNRLARNQMRVHVAPAEGWEDNSGMYWIGDKVYFCRILRSQTVMVRIGGGWCELSAFIIEHLRLTTLSNAAQLELRTAGGSEKLSQVDQIPRSVLENSPSINPSLPTSSVVPSCHSSPSNLYNRSSGTLTDSSTSSTPRSSIATVLITTPQEIRLSSHPALPSSSGSDHKNNPALQHTPPLPNNNPFLSTPTEAIHMFLRKAENRNYLSNNYSPHHHLHPPLEGVITDSIVHHKLNAPRKSFSPASAPKFDPSSLSASTLGNSHRQRSSSSSHSHSNH